jgi:glycosyltransferase involved in cell wall biosynthesis
LPSTALIERHPRVHYHGTLAPQEMARLFGRCSVGLVPYLDNPYTAGVFPMKLFEYLAAGLAVASTALPSIPRLPHVELCTTNDAFVAAVDQLAELPTPSTERDRIELARRHSWERRGHDAYELIREGLALSTGAHT